MQSYSSLPGSQQGLFWISALSVFLVGWSLALAFHEKKIVAEGSSLTFGGVISEVLSEEVTFRQRPGEVSHVNNAVKDVLSKEPRCKRLCPENQPKTGGHCGQSKGSKEEGDSDQLESQKEPDRGGPWWVTKKICLLTKEVQELFEREKGYHLICDHFGHHVENGQRVQEESKERGSSVANKQSTLQVSR